MKVLGITPAFDNTKQAEKWINKNLDQAVAGNSSPQINERHVFVIIALDEKIEEVVLVPVKESEFFGGKEIKFLTVKSKPLHSEQRIKEWIGTQLPRIDLKKLHISKNDLPLIVVIDKIGVRAAISFVSHREFTGKSVQLYPSTKTLLV